MQFSIIHSELLRYFMVTNPDPAAFAAVLPPDDVEFVSAPEWNDTSRGTIAFVTPLTAALALRTHNDMETVLRLARIALERRVHSTMMMGIEIHTRTGEVRVSRMGGDPFLLAMIATSDRPDTLLRFVRLFAEFGLQPDATAVVMTLMQPSADLVPAEVELVRLASRQAQRDALYDVLNNMAFFGAIGKIPPVLAPLVVELRHPEDGGNALHMVCKAATTVFPVEALNAAITLLVTRFDVPPCALDRRGRLAIEHVSFPCTHELLRVLMRDAIRREQPLAHAIALGCIEGASPFAELPDDVLRRIVEAALPCAGVMPH